jgi:hypothetical protein
MPLILKLAQALAPRSAQPPHKARFWDKTPVVQPTTGISGATFVADSGGSIHPSSTFDGYTIAQVVAALRQLGILLNYYGYFSNHD